GLLPGPDRAGRGSGHPRLAEQALGAGRLRTPDGLRVHDLGGGPRRDAGRRIHASLSTLSAPAGSGPRTGYECTISVGDLGAIRAAILAHGGKILFDEYEIVGVGRMIRFEDSEGNSACAMRYFEEEKP